MDGPVRVPEMSVAPHHHCSPHYIIDHRSPSLYANTPLSPASTLAPILQRASQDQYYSQDRAYYSPSRDSFVSKPSISEASHVPSSPSSASFTSDQQSRSASNHASSSHQTNGRHGHHSTRHSPRRSRDREKYVGSSASQPRRSPGPSTVVSDVTTVTYAGGYDDQEDERKQLESKALRILIYLSAFAPITSFLLSGYTLVLLILWLLAQPVRVIKSRPPPSVELSNLLSPGLRFQLRLISSTAESDTYSAPMLLCIHLLSPFVSIGVALASWTAAFFWFFSAVLGDPAGKDGHNDGKAAVLGVRAWWEKWLCRGLT